MDISKVKVSFFLDMKQIFFIAKKKMDPTLPDPFGLHGEYFWLEAKLES